MLPVRVSGAAGVRQVDELWRGSKRGDCLHSRLRPQHSPHLHRYGPHEGVRVVGTGGVIHFVKGVTK